MSYTQYEALYARKMGKKVWYLFLDEHFPCDACVDEPEELRALQTAYRNRLKADAHLYHPLTSLEGLEASVLKLRGDLMQLRKGAKRWAAGVAIRTTGRTRGELLAPALAAPHLPANDRNATGRYKCQ